MALCYKSLIGAEKWPRDHHENSKFAYRHVEKYTDSKKMLFFSIYDEKNEVISENRFRTVASPGACERLAVFIDARRQYILFVDYIHLFSDDEERFVWVIGSLQILSRICGRDSVQTVPD